MGLTHSLCIMHLMYVYIHENKSMMQYHLKFMEYSIKKYDAISSKVTGVIDVTRAPKFLGALKVVPKLVASDQKIGRSWMLVKFLNFDLCTSSLCNEIIISSYT